MENHSLLKLLEYVAKECGYLDPKIEIKAISSGGANYTSTLNLATISSQLKEDMKLFAKVSQLSDSLRSDPMMGRVFETERMFYTELAKNYEAIEDKNNVLAEHRFLKPKYYTCNPNFMEEILVLEDLTAKGFKCHDRMKAFNWEYASKAVEQMAKFHALSFAYQQEYPEEFNQMQEKYSFESLPLNDMMKTFYGKLMENSVGLIKKEFLGNVKTFLDDENIIEKCMQLYLPKTRPVIVHGDYRASNLMHRRRNGKLEIVPVDYQTIHIGSPISDFYYLVFTGSDQQFRKLHYRNLLEHYYLQLRLALNRLNLDINTVYPKEDLETDMKEVQMLGLITAMTVLSIVTVEENEAPRLDKDSVIDDFAAKPSLLYAERLNGIVEDYIRWGII